MYRCKSCDKKREDKRKWKDRLANESIEQRKNRLATTKKYNKSFNGKSSSLLKAYLNFDNSRGYENDLTLDDIKWAKTSKCVYCGYDATGFDRIDNKKGHTTDNVVPCCKECNIARMDNFSHEEMFILGKAIKVVKDLRIINNIKL